MPTATEKLTSLTSRGTVLTTELNALANGSQAVYRAHLMCGL